MTKDRPNPPWPQNILIELTNVCDLKCRHCPFHGDGVEKHRPTGHMSRDIWQRAIDEILSWDSELTLQPWGMGEPLLSPDLWEVVRAAKASPRVKVGFFTNGNQWRPEDIDAALTSGLDWVSFSIDGVREEVFEHYRRGAVFDRVMGALRALADARRRVARATPEIRVNMVQYPELADHGEEFVAAMEGLADSVMVSRFRAVGERAFSPITLPRVPCYQLDTFLGLAWDGRVVQCCEDQQGRHPVGWFPKQSLAEIWRGPRLEALRRMHREGRYADAPMCGDCDGWTSVYERTIPARDRIIRERTTSRVYERARAEVERG